jgi:hypothetical protein
MIKKKCQRQNSQQQQKQPGEAGLINKELNCGRLNKDMIIIDIFSWLSRYFRPFSRPVIRGCEDLALFEPVLGDLRIFPDNW